MTPCGIMIIYPVKQNTKAWTVARCATNGKLRCAGYEQLCCSLRISNNLQENTWTPPLTCRMESLELEARILQKFSSSLFLALALQKENLCTPVITGDARLSCEQGRSIGETCGQGCRGSAPVTKARQHDPRVPTRTCSGAMPSARPQSLPTEGP